jgi:folate-dependent phosphoribosylglycinamide formyltransferase PurN
MISFRIFLLAYPDNPVGRVFLKTFLKRKIPVQGIIVEEKNRKVNWDRFVKKVNKDGFFTALRRVLQVYALKYTGLNIVSLAKRNGLEVHSVGKFNSIACAALLESLDIDLLTIASAPILKEEVFKYTTVGCLNAHPGWLPKYRGLGANAYCILNGENPGVTIHFLDAGIDSGMIISREKLKIRPRDTIAKINDRAMIRGAEMMADVIHQFQEGKLEIPEIDEPQGKLYRSMAYERAKKLNKRISVLSDVKIEEYIN